uniref:SFRICE_035743 n=1 Tax=Spodoptera frugiperda TaxID=7108 RepID=A0A2H1VX43_SPOFR
MSRKSQRTTVGQKGMINSPGLGILLFLGNFTRCSLEYHQNQVEDITQNRPQAEEYWIKFNIASLAMISAKINQRNNKISR